MNKAIISEPQSSEPTKPLISLKGLNKHYVLKDREIPALHDVTMDIHEGSIIGIIGRSGAGKSTLLRCINRLENPDSGQVFYKDIRVTQASTSTLRNIRHEMGMIFQHFNLLSRRNVLQNVMLPLEIAGCHKQKAKQKATECLKLVGLHERANAYPAELSGGQKQRVAIARALACNAEVLLCDEATSALDPETTTEILHLLRDLNQRLGLTIVLITHEISVIRDICHEVYVMDHGKVVESGSAEQIFSKPTHPITQTFIRSVVNSKIPQIVREHLSPKPDPKSECNIVLRLTFAGEAAEEPIISHCIREYATDINILAGYLDHIGTSLFGTLIITLSDDPETIENVSKYLSNQGIDIEILGYIPKHV